MFFDYNDGDFCFGSKNNNILYDSNGDMMTRLSDNTALDWKTGDIHFGFFGSHEDDDSKH